MYEIEIYDGYNSQAFDEDLSEALEYAENGSNVVIEFVTRTSGRAFAEYLAGLKTWQVILEESL